jgi:hypothetical protein
MIAEELQTERWPRSRWFLLIAAVCFAQVSLLFWLGDAKPVPPRPLSPPPTLDLSGRARGEMLALKDPTLFALPHRNGFSGPGWLIVPPQKFTPYAWSEPLDWLPLPITELGGPFQQFVATNSDSLWQFAPPMQPLLTMPEPAHTELLPRASTLRVDGPLSQRPMLAALELPSWPHAELLTNTIIQIVVDAEGKPVSVTLLRPSSGWTNADQYALNQARAVRFAPIKPAGPEPAMAGLTWGELVFQWHTAPALTNSPPPQ